MKLHRTVLLLVLILCTSLQVSASHLMGGSISYEYLGYNAGTNLYSYRIIAKVYRYCDSTGTGGTPAALDQQLTTGIYPQNPFQPNANKSLYTTLSLPLISSAFIVPPSTNPNCTVGNNVCVQEGIYQATINLPPSIGGYHLIIDRCCRNYNIANLNVVTPPGSGAAYYAFIPPTSNPNTSPVFATAPVPYICFGDTVSVLNSAFDADGDSLVYSFQVPYKGLSSSNTPVPNPPGTYTWPIPNTTYAPGFSIANPFGTGGYASIDANTGLTNYYVPSQGFYVVAIEIREFRNGVLIGITRRDIQLIVIPCSPNSSPANTSGGGAGTTNYTSDGGGQLCFQIEYTDADGDSLFLDVNGPIFDSTVTNPAATISVVNGPGTTSGQFCWNTPCVSTSTTFQFTTSATDNGCPPKTTNAVFSIQVNPVLVAGFTGPDTVCGNQGQFTYSVNPGANAYGWIVNGGTISGPSNGSSIDVSWTDSLGTISVYALNANGCPSDTLSKQIIAYQPQAIAGTDVSFCEGDSAQLGIAGTTGQTYSWSPVSGLSDPSISNPTASPAITGAIPYVLTSTVGTCSVTDTVIVTVNPNPTIQFTAFPFLCASDQPISLSQASPSGGAYSGPGVTNGQFDPSQSGAGSFVIEYTFSNLSGCTASATSNIQVNPAATASAGTDVTFCEGDSAQIGTANIPGQTYSWTPSTGLSDPSISNPSVVASTAGSTNYILTTELNGCTASDQVEVTVNPNPVVVFAPLAALCESNSAIVLNQATPSGGTYSGTGVSNSTFDPTLAGPGSFQIDYSYTDALGCSSQSSSILQVNADPIVTLSNLGTTCVNGSPITLAGGNPAGGTYSGPGITNGQFDPSSLPQGSYTYYYEYSDANGCSGIDSASITIGSASSVTVSAISGQNCIANTIYIGYGPQSITLTAQANTTGLSYQWYLDGIAITGATGTTYSATSAGDYSVIVTDAGGCSSSASDPGSHIQINSIDVRCGNNNSKVIICHVPPGNSGNPQTLCIAPSAVPAHLAEHDEDCLGPCPGTRLDHSPEAMNETFAVYPNPFGQSIRLTFEVEENQSVEAIILDAAGREMMKLFEGQIHQHTHFDRTFDVSNLSRGVYILRLSRGGEVEFKKISSNN